jgi:hypothetical protein
MTTLLMFVQLLVGGLLLLRLLVAAYNWKHKSSLYLPAAPCVTSDSVSLLIPVRNELHQLPEMFGNLKGLQAGLHELIIYDDDSTDGSTEWLRQHLHELPGSKLIVGGSLPSGWLGKNHACHQLAQQASGRWWLFIDADVRLQLGVIEQAVATATQEQAALLSLFPHQISLSRGEQMLVPFMHHVLLSWLPMGWVTKCKSAVFSAANGQFMLFEASNYQQHAWHQRYALSLLEDVAIMQGIKGSGARGLVYLGTPRQVSCRMYQSGEQALQGFSKSLLAAVNYQTSWLVIYAALSGPLLVLLVVIQPHLLLFLLPILLLNRIFVSLSSNESVRWNLLHYLPQQWSWQVLLWTAVTRYHKKQIRWKDRPVR